MATPEFKTEVDKAADKMQAILDRINAERGAAQFTLHMLVFACLACLLVGFIAGWAVHHG